MARIRKVEIENFRGIKSLTWHPSAGINCLIGHGDGGKSTILDAIDFCLGARRNLSLTDADFHQIDVDTPIRITVTLGDLDDGLKSLEAYGLYLRGFDAQSQAIEDEPEKGTETVLMLRLTVESDLEPLWSLISDRAEEQDKTRNLNWMNRVRLAPTRIGATADYHLGWRRGSVLNRLSDEQVEGAAALAKAAREARSAFGTEVQEQLQETLRIVSQTAGDLGIRAGDDLQALLDAHSVSFSGGAVSLHDPDGVPLRGLGVGSTRLLIAGLQRRAASQSTMILIDELEHGLEPHRIIRFLHSLGAKEEIPPLQVFASTHSPAAIRELSGSQLFVVRPEDDRHEVLAVGASDDMQSTIRLFPEAYLASSVVLCEGASEVGLVRGLDQYQTSDDTLSIAAHGVALVDCGGGSADEPFKRAAAFQSLGYRTAIVRDDDKKPNKDLENQFSDQEGKLIKWRDDRALEDELFLSLTSEAVMNLIDRAIENRGEALVGDHIHSASEGNSDLDGIRKEGNEGNISQESRRVLGKASRPKNRKNAWFKSVTLMEAVAYHIVGPDLDTAEPEFTDRVEDLFNWARNDAD